MRSRALFLAIVALVAVVGIILLVGGSDSPSEQAKVALMHQGTYESVEDLLRDARRYAGA